MYSVEFLLVKEELQLIVFNIFGDLDYTQNCIVGLRRAVNLRKIRSYRLPALEYELLISRVTRFALLLRLAASVGR